ncbi:hypothetical protein [Bacillus dakarensis]|nr:hypothetical protein [Bacillus dakarensis]
MAGLLVFITAMMTVSWSADLLFGFHNGDDDRFAECWLAFWFS